MYSPIHVTALPPPDLEQCVARHSVQTVALVHLAQPSGQAVTKTNKHRSTKLGRKLLFKHLHQTSYVAPHTIWIVTSHGSSQWTLDPVVLALLAIITLSAAQSFPRLLIHNAILFINTSTMLGTREVIG